MNPANGSVFSSSILFIYVYSFLIYFRLLRKIGVCLWSPMKMAVSEVSCCHRNNTPVYKLHGDVNPDCTITWLTRDNKMIVDDSGNVDPDTVVSYEHGELTVKSRDCDVLVREDCLSLGERKINCTALCKPEKPNVTENLTTDRISPLIISFIILGLVVLLLLLIIPISVGVVVYKRLQGSHDFENANTINETNDHHNIMELQPLQ
ncbi:uncharacterized protein LOC128634495 isoform X2 [Ictalurus punctatus]|uniref:Uncharacterized protein LOC128634495 isoform X2 n=1 Tax=Ictalurus punctatus TaxID=7998 RepID=A0A9F7TQ67_ICTPU|nr:uncharacterized protein LOC128634495 isoform X2 [Ictalurus punctatus]